MEQNKIKLNKIESDAIKIYKKILDKKLERFPRNFWIGEEAIIKSNAITRYFIEEVLKWDIEKVKEKIELKLFRKYNLWGMLNSMHDGTYSKAIIKAYPEYNIRPWDFAVCQNGYWTLDTAREATKWLIEEELKISTEDIPKKITKESFTDNGLGGMLRTAHNNSVYEAIENAYPDMFRPWNFHCPKNYWNKETAIEATKWLIEKKLKLTVAQLLDILSVKMFDDNDLRGMLYGVYYNSPYDAIEAAYPRKFKNIRNMIKLHRSRIRTIK